MLKISIITSTFNCDTTIRKTIESVLNQTYNNFEYIIIDNKSSDKTLDIISEYKSRFKDKLKVISEKDDGISDAFNKGIKNSSGDYLYFLGGDDFFLNDRVIERVFGSRKSCENLICGKVRIVSENLKNIIGIFPKTNTFDKKSLLFKMSLPHQSLFTPKSYFDKYGLFDIKNIFSMDYEILLRAYKNFPEVEMVDVEIAAWRAGGIGAERHKEVLKEYNLIKIKNKVAPYWLLVVLNKYTFLKYYTKKILIKLKLVGEIK